MSAADLAETAARISREGLAGRDWNPDAGASIPPQVPRSKAPLTSLCQATPIPRQADTDADLVSLWLHGRPATTRITYEHALSQFRRYIGGKSIRFLTLRDLHGFQDSLGDLSPNGQLTYMRVVKSLLGFAHRIGYLSFNVGAAWRLPRADDCLHERYLTEPEINAMLALESDQRNHAIIRLLYVGGLRAAEVVGLKWRDLQPKGSGGILSVLGKRHKRRSVVIPADMWEELVALRQGAPDDAPVFASRAGPRSARHGGHLTSHQLIIIVREAAVRAGIEKPVSPHWLRHTHISHALDHGAPLHVVMASVGHANLATTGRYSHARPDDGSANYLGGTVEYEPDPRPPFDGAALREARKAAGLRQRELADVLGISREYLVTIETGLGRPSENLATKIRVWMDRARLQETAAPWGRP